MHLFQPIDSEMRFFVLLCASLHLNQFESVDSSATFDVDSVHRVWDKEKKKHTQTHSWCIGAWWSVVRHRRSNWLQWLSMFTMPNCESTLNCVPLQFIHCFFVPYSKLNSQCLEWNWEDNNKIILFCMHNKYIFQGPILKCAASAHRNGAAAYSTISVFSESKQKNWFFGLPICVAIAVPAFRCFFASFHSISASVFMEYSFFLSVAVASICIAFKFSSIDREQRHNIHRHSWSSWTSRHTSSFVMRRWHSHSSHTHNTETVFARDEYVRRAFFFLMHLFGCGRESNLWCKFYSRNRQMCERNARWAKNDSDSICSTNELFANEKISGCTGSDSVHSGETCWVGRNQSTRPMLQIPQEWASLSNIECGRFLVGGRLWF